MNGAGNEFIEKTKYKYEEQSAQSKGLPQPPLETDYDLSRPLIALPKPDNTKYGQVSLIEVINGRRSVRQYSERCLSLDELSYLLWCTQGVKKADSAKYTLRTVPSAGARHAFETYLLINRVEGLKPGLYRYLALEHKLLEINIQSGITEEVVAGCLGQGFAGKSAVTFIWAADVKRMKWRYEDRGYRYLHLDAGHVCQNLYLAAEAINCGVCAIAAFEDDLINSTLGLDGKEQFVIYVAAAGKKD